MSPAEKEAESNIAALATSAGQDDILRRFVSAWGSSPLPVLAGDAAEVPEPKRESLLRDLIRIDSEIRRQSYDMVHSTGESALKIGQETHTNIHPATDDFPTIAPERSYAASKTPFNRIGDYELQGEIARGGMGVVYKARHVLLDRIAAVKLIKSGQLADDRELRRFHVEAQARSSRNCVGV